MSQIGGNPTGCEQGISEWATFLWQSVERITLLEAKIARLKKLRSDLSAKQSQASGKTFGYGGLKKKIGDLAKRDGYKVGDRVPSTRVAKWCKEIKAEGYTTTDAAIRAKLSALDITKERPQKK